MKAEALANGTVVTTTKHGSMAIMDAHEALEDGSVLPARSIWLSKTAAEKLRDFLNEEYPSDKKVKYENVVGVLQWILNNPESDDIINVVANTLEDISNA